MPDITKSELQHWQEVCEKATEGPWEISDDDKFSPIVIESPTIDICTLDTYSQRPSDRIEDARLIALARSALPAAIARIRELERELAEVVEAKAMSCPNCKRYRSVADAQSKLLDELPPSADELIMAQMDAAVARTERDQARADLAAANRELERWRHGVTVEGDFVCPDSVALTEARAEADRMRAVYEAAVKWREAKLGGGWLVGADAELASTLDVAHASREKAKEGSK